MAKKPSRRPSGKAATGPNDATNGSDPRSGSRDLQALLQRFPMPSRWSILSNALCVLIGNAWLLSYVWRGQLAAMAIVLLIATEAAVLSLLANWERRRIPASDRMQAQTAEPLTWQQRVLRWIGAVVGIGGAYALWTVILGEWGELKRLLTEPGAWHDTGIGFALVWTLLWVPIAMLTDWQHYRRNGPPFVSSADLEATGKRAIVAFGAVVIALPTFAMTLLATLLAIRIQRRHDTGQTRLIAGLSVLVAFFGTFHLLAWLADQGKIGWALVFLLNKVAVELTLLMVPLLARRAELQTAKPVTASASPGGS